MPRQPTGEAADVPFERLAWLKAQEQFILTLTSEGMGKRASAYEYRITGRGGKGLIAHKLTGDARLVASFPVQDDEEIMVVTDKGQLIRTGDGPDPHRRTGDARRDRDQCRRGRARRRRRTPGGPARCEAGDATTGGGEAETSQDGRRPRAGKGNMASEPRRALSRHVRSDHERPHRHHRPRRKLVDKLIIGVAINQAKGPLFSPRERVEMLSSECAGSRGVPRSPSILSTHC